jgi:hypothetical protein
MQKTLRHFTLLAVLTLISNLAESAVLISPIEAAMPDDSVKSNTRGIIRGPGVEVVSPDLNSIVKGAFNFKVEFKERGGNKIDKDSIKVIYMKSPNIELTPRLNKAISEKGIFFDNAEAPSGTHLIKIILKDVDGRETENIFSIKVNN